MIDSSKFKHYVLPIEIQTTPAKRETFFVFQFDMGKGSDKLYLTSREWAQDFGGKTASSGTTSKSISGKYKRLPFNCCSLSLQPFTHPVCSPEGHIFDLASIVPHLQSHPINPINGTPLVIKDLIRLHMHKNQQGHWHCPITYKVFSEHVKVVAIRTSGQVYAWDAVYKLCIKPGHWRDLMTDVEFKQEDLIVLQDPADLSNRDISKFHFVQHSTEEASKSGVSSGAKSTSRAAGSKLADRIMKTLESTEIPSLASISKPVPKDQVNIKEYTKFSGTTSTTAHYSKGKMAASLTSTSMPIVSYNESAQLDSSLMLYPRVSTSSRGLVQIETSLGNLNVELDCHLAPKTCHNFILLAKSGYYKGTVFHRLIRNFMVQGGDPTGTGRGGKSFWGGEFEDEIEVPSYASGYVAPGAKSGTKAEKRTHDKRGVLSMANKGKNTNTSQFFITFGACTHLDKKHTIFGRVLNIDGSGEDVLNKIERVPVDADDKPRFEIKILDVTVLKDPFEEVSMNQEPRQQGQTEKKRSRMEDETESKMGRLISDSSGSKSTVQSVAVEEKKVKKLKSTSRLSDFSGW